MSQKRRRKKEERSQKGNCRSRKLSNTILYISPFSGMIHATPRLMEFHLLMKKIRCLNLTLGKFQTIINLTGLLCSDFFALFSKAKTITSVSPLLCTLTVTQC